MLSVKRAKRDTAENLYRQCQITGTCIPDVVDKIEGKTWADTLLQIFSSVIYLGNLGIGTGKTSPTVGSRVVTGGVRVPETIAPPTTSAAPIAPKQPVSRPVRPFSVPIDPIGAGTRPLGPRVVDPSGLRPVDVIDPTSPSIVTLSETLPDNVVTTGTGTLPDLEVVTDTVSISSHPTVLQTPESDLAILNVTPADPPPRRVIFSTTNINPAFTFESTVGHINPDYEVIVNPFATVETISFGEDIPLEPVNPMQEFEIEDIPRSSTPSSALQRSVSRFRNLYNRATEQVPTRNANLLGDVSRAIRFGFENPAFDPEVSLQFEEDVADVLAAPDSDFANIRHISKPILTTTKTGQVRVSRLGTRAGVRTRSGTLGAKKVHFYYDISNIEEIELPTISTNLQPTVRPTAKTTVIDSTLNVNTDTELIDEYSETFNNAQLVFPLLDEEDETVFVPVVHGLPPTTLNSFNSSLNSYISSTNVTHIIPAVPITPNSFGEGYSVDYDLHPSLLLRRKRKRSDSF